jgi:hypothetical protein
MPRVNNRAPVGDHIGFSRMFAPARLTLVVVNFKYGRRDTAEVLEAIGREIFPQLDAGQSPIEPKMT